MKINMNKTKQVLTLLGGIGAGATLMYFLDPDRGNRRRALVRDKAVGLSNDVKNSVNAYATDVKNRAAGTYYEARALLGSGAEKVMETATNTLTKAEHLLAREEDANMPKSVANGKSKASASSS